MLRSTLTVAVIAIIVFASQPLWAGQVLVACKGAQKLVFHDTETGKQLGAVDTGRDAREVIVSPDGRRAYVSVFGGSESIICVVDVPTRTLETRFKIDKMYGPHGMAITSDGKSLYVTLEKSRKVARLDAATGTVAKSINIGMMGSHYLALSHDGSQLFVANVVDDNVTFIDTDGDRIVHHRSAGDYPEGLAVSPDDKELWVASQGSNDIRVFDLAGEQKVTATLHANGTPARLAFTPDGSRVLATCATLNQLFVFDAKARTVIKHVETGGTPFGVAVSPDGKSAFVCVAAENRVAVFDLDTLEFVRDFATLETPAGIAFVD